MHLPPPAAAPAAPPGPLRIGALARALGISPDTLRLYERHGLLPPPARSPSGQRLYRPETLARLHVVRAALALGFSLAELSEVFAQRARGEAPCRRVRALAQEKLEALEEELRSLALLREALRSTLAAWDARLADTAEGRPAGLLEALARNLPPLPARPSGPPRRLAPRPQGAPAPRARSGAAQATGGAR